MPTLDRRRRAGRQPGWSASGRGRLRQSPGSRAAAASRRKHVRVRQIRLIRSGPVCPSARSVPLPASRRERRARRGRPRSMTCAFRATATPDVPRRRTSAAHGRRVPRSTSTIASCAIRRVRRGRRELLRRASGSRASRTARSTVRATGRGYRTVVGIERDRHVGANPRQFPARARRVGVRQQRLAVPLLRELAARPRAARRASRASPISSRAPFSPMPGTPLMLSTLSPISASTSTTWSGRTPNFSTTPPASYQVPSSRGL